MTGVFLNVLNIPTKTDLKQYFELLVFHHTHTHTGRKKKNAREQQNGSQTSVSRYLRSNNSSGGRATVFTQQLQLVQLVALGLPIVVATCEGRVIDLQNTI